MCVCVFGVIIIIIIIGFVDVGSGMRLGGSSTSMCVDVYLCVLKILLRFVLLAFTTGSWCSWCSWCSCCSCQDQDRDDDDDDDCCARISICG